MTKSELEILLRDIVKNRDEYYKVDQKSTYDFSKKKDRVRLVKCIAAIANTDDTRFENIGYIILGAAEGRLVGGFDDLKKDSVSADMQGWVTEYIDPAIIFSVDRFIDQQVGWWGVIVIAPSSETHIFKKKFEEQGLNIRSGDLYVRHGDSISSANRNDYDRLQRRKFQSAYDNLATEIHILKEKVEEQKAQKPDLKLYFLDDKDNRHESIELQPLFWEKTTGQLEEEALVETRIAELEKKLHDHNRQVLTTHNVISTQRIGDLLLHNLQELKLEHYENQKNDPLISRINKLNISLYNNGNALATGISFYIYFPNSLELAANVEAFLKKQIPTNPHFEQLLSVLPGIIASSHGSSSYSPSPPIPDFANPKYGGPEIISQENDIVAKFWIEKLMQHHGHSFDSIYFISPEEKMDIDVHYKIYAQNAPGVIQASLQLRVRPKRNS